VSSGHVKVRAKRNSHLVWIYPRLCTDSSSFFNCFAHKLKYFYSDVLKTVGCFTKYALLTSSIQICIVFTCFTSVTENERKWYEMASLIILLIIRNGNFYTFNDKEPQLLQIEFFEATTLVTLWIIRNGNSYRLNCL
jgi:hypothetical protein